jgi:glutamine synthetase
LPANRGKRLRLLWPDLHGLERGKVLFGDAAQRAAANFCLATFPLTFDREILPIPGTAFDVGLPDLDAHLDVPSTHGNWLDEGGTVGVGDLLKDHKPLPIDPRYVLRRAAGPWRDRGLHPQVAFEFEFYLLEPDAGGGWRPISTPGSRVYGTGMSVDPAGIVEEICETAETCGFAVEGWASEFDDAQYEVNLHHKDVLLAADEAFLFRILVRELAARRGHRATFMGRPFGDRGGSGLHVNLSFKDVGGKNVLHDPNDPDQLAGIARSCLAGMLAHHTGTAAICAPTVNAYKRLLPDMMNGYWANWGHDDRTVAIRISPERGPSTRLENRVPDGAANPYLATAALLHACRMGVDEELKIPDPQTSGEPPATDVHAPTTLPEALEAMAADTAMSLALGHELVEAFTILKQAEWDRYVKAVEDPATTEPTPWEIEYYQPFI